MSRPIERSAPKVATSTKPVKNEVAAPAATNKALPGPASDGFATRNTAAATAAATTAVKPALPVDPLEAAKLVKNGDLNLTIPMKAGKLPIPGGLVSAKEGTVITFTGKVKDGKIDQKTLKLSFNPPLDGPLFADVRGAKVVDGRFQLDIKGLPDPQFGPKLPTRFSDFVGALQGVANEKKVEVSFFGISLGKFGPGNTPGGTASASTGKSGAAALKEAPIDIGRAHLSLKNVELGEGKLSLGNAGSIQVGSGSKFTIEGGLNDIRMKGSANIAGLDLNTAGVTVKGSEGSADFDIRYTKGADGKATVATKIDNLNLYSEHAVSRRPNGDYISLAQGRIANGSLRLNETVQHGPDGLSVKSVKHGLESFKMQEFDGVLQSAQLTIPDANGKATVRVGRSEVHGGMEIGKDGVYFDGSIDAQATIEDFQGGKGPVSVDVKKATVKGSGNLLLDTRKGKGDFELSDGNFSLDANFNKAAIDGKLPVVGLPAHASIGKGSKLKVGVSDVDFSFDKGISVGGANFGVDLKKPKVDVAGMELGTDRIQIGDTGGKKTKPALPEPTPEPVKPAKPAKPAKPTAEAKVEEEKQIADALAAIRGKSYLVRGAKGPEVKEIQKLLVKAGFKVSVDGDFGPQTEAAVKAYQKKKGLIVDGHIGQQTWGSFFGLKLSPSKNMPPMLDKTAS